MSQYDIEEASIHERLARGEITNAEAIKELNELDRDYRLAAIERAEEAYWRELEKW